VGTTAIVVNAETQGPSALQKALGLMITILLVEAVRPAVPDDMSGARA